MLVQTGLFLPRTRAEGPGPRAALWVQGCSIQCKGCFNPHFFNARGGTAIEVRTLAAQILEAQVEGLTLLGGEPFDQAPALAELAGLLKAKGLNILTFSGFTWERLNKERQPGWQDLLAVTDVLVAGPYLQHHQTFSRPMIGSANQTIHSLSDNGKELEQRLLTGKNLVEIRLRPDGALLINGQGPGAGFRPSLPVGKPSPQPTESSLEL